MKPGSSSGRYPALLGSHEVQRVVARGGMGAVYEVKHRQTGVRAAAKVIIQAQDPRARERFRREAELLARCERIPGVVKVHSFGESQDGTLFMILDFIDGPSLEKLIADHKRLQPEKAARLVRDVARALGQCHAQGMVHRDVKPANVLLDGEGKPWLTDFGLAAARDMERLTRTGSFVGTITYCAPEQAYGVPCGPTSDVFSLGCVLFHALAGEPPVESTSALDHMARLASDDAIRDVRSVERTVPAPLASIVARALVKDPEGRYQDGEALARDLDRFLEGGKVEGLVGSNDQARLVRILVAVAVLLAVAAVVVWCVRASSSSVAFAQARSEAERAWALVLQGGDLDEARRAADAARAALARGQQGGASAADDVVRAVDAASGEVATKLAERALARSPKDALALLERERVLPFDGDVARVRALLALGRAADAAPVISEAAIEAQPEARRAEVYELLGDACAGSDDARAERAYTAALKLGGRSPDLRARRGGAAAAVLDDDVALADFRALVPDLGRLSATRAKNAALARIAPALYRRGLAAPDDALLEAAWRLAPPLPAVESQVAERWIASAVDDASAWANNFLSTTNAGEREVFLLRPILARAGRVPSKRPDLYHAGFASPLQLVRNWIKNDVPHPILERTARAFLEDWPDQPLFLFMLSWGLKDVSGREDESLDLIRRAIEHIPPFEQGEDPEVRRLASQCAFYYVERSHRANKTPDLEVARVAAYRGEYSEGWIWLARAYIDAGEPEKALEAVLKAEHTTSTTGGALSDEEAQEVRAAAQRLLDRKKQ